MQVEGREIRYTGAKHTDIGSYSDGAGQIPPAPPIRIVIKDASNVSVKLYSRRPRRIVATS